MNYVSSRKPSRALERIHIRYVDYLTRIILFTAVGIIAFIPIRSS